VSYAGTGDSEKAVDEEITNQLLLAPGLVQRVQGREESSKVLANLHVLQGFQEAHISHEPLCAKFFVTYMNIHYLT
jgi:hypothetical protein